MYYKILYNDILKHKVVAFIMTAFITGAAMLMAMAAVLSVNLFGAIDTLMIDAKTPHFMQMHSGVVDKGRLQAFAKQSSSVEDFQIVEFLNVEGANIIIGENSFEGSVQDNGFCVQSKNFDYLLDLKADVIKVRDGQLYVPLCYMKNGKVKVGDTAKVGENTFTVAGFLRDSQMNALLASSKRFLISENDYKKIKEMGRIEYLIEFRLKNLEMLSAFENTYTSKGLEANGPTLTYPLFKMLNALSDGLMIAVILLISIVVVAIALMCIRFTLLAAIEEDYREIGVMKAIGLRVSVIKKMYLVKYAGIGAIGCMLGLGLSFAFKSILLRNIRLYIGESKNTSLVLVLGIVSVLFVFLTILLYVNGILMRFHKISATEALRFGIAKEKLSKAKILTLSKNRLLNTHFFLGIKDVVARRKLYRTMLIVLVFALFIIIVPQNLYTTISSKDFMAYMGLGKCDIRMDIQQTDHITEKVEDIVKILKKDHAIGKYATFITKTFTVKREDGSKVPIKIELGNHSVFPIKYLEGKAPFEEDEIALSVMNGQALGKKVGDSIKLVSDNEEKQLTICGIYSDITNGGKTAKAIFKDNKRDVMWGVIAIELLDKSFVRTKALEYGDQFRFAKVSAIEEYTRQTFGSTIGSIQKASYIGSIMALLITILITVLFIKMLVSKDRQSIAIMKSLGFENAHIIYQYIARSLVVVVLGISTGVFLANTLGEVLVGMVISSFGAASFKFTINPFGVYVFYPLLMIGAVVGATVIGTLEVGKIKISQNIKE